MRRIITVVVVALVTAAMMLVVAMPVFAQPGGSENSCGASNPNIGVPAGPPPVKGEEGEEFEDCGFRNNPHISGIPPSQEN